MVAPVSEPPFICEELKMMSFWSSFEEVYVLLEQIWIEADGTMKG